MNSSKDAKAPLCIVWYGFSNSGRNSSPFSWFPSSKYTSGPFPAIISVLSFWISFSRSSFFSGSCWISTSTSLFVPSVKVAAASAWSCKLPSVTTRRIFSSSLFSSVPQLQSPAARAHTHNTDIPFRIILCFLILFPPPPVQLSGYYCLNYIIVKNTCLSL